MLHQHDSQPLRELRDRLSALHEKARSGTLTDEERPFYERTRDDLARMLLFAQQMTREPGQTFRNALRVKVALDVVVVRAGNRVSSKTIDLSAGGFAAALPGTAEVGTATDVELTLRRGDVLTARAKIVAATASGDSVRASFAFDTLAPRDAERVAVAVFDQVLPELAKL